LENNKLLEYIRNNKKVFSLNKELHFYWRKT